MQVITDLSNLPPSARGSLLAIGNFDGVHRGHQAILKQLKEKAQTMGCAAAVLTFEPHPRKLFRPDDPPFRITPAPLKQQKLAASSIDYVFSLPFDWDFASQSAESFVQHILVDGLAPAGVMVGHDFRFGQLRKGTPSMIEAAGIPIHQIADIADEEGRKFASTQVREALYAGDIDAANRILGWKWMIEGEIIRGDRRGHELGYPTANVMLGDTLHPSYGVYAALVQVEGETAWRAAATNIGIRPMFELKIGQVEAHILDFADRDIYGKKLKIQPVKRLRGEAKFDSLDALISQIEADCRLTRDILKKHL